MLISLSNEARTVHQWPFHPAVSVLRPKPRTGHFVVLGHVVLAQSDLRLVHYPVTEVAAFSPKVWKGNNLFSILLMEAVAMATTLSLRCALKSLCKYCAMFSAQPVWFPWWHTKQVERLSWPPCYLEENWPRSSLGFSILTRLAHLCRRHN